METTGIRGVIHGDKGKENGNYRGYRRYRRLYRDYRFIFGLQAFLGCDVLLVG